MAIPIRGDNFDLVYDDAGWRGDPPPPALALVLVALINARKKQDKTLDDACNNS